MKINKVMLVELFDSWHSHSLYKPEDVVKELKACGIDAKVGIDEKSVIVYNEVIRFSEGDWGAGISPLAVLGAVFEGVLHKEARSDCHGRGFWYQNVTKQFKKALTETMSYNEIGQDFSTPVKNMIKFNKSKIIQLITTEGETPETPTELIALVQYLTGNTKGELVEPITYDPLHQEWSDEDLEKWETYCTDDTFRDKVWSLYAENVTFQRLQFPNIDEIMSVIRSVPDSNSRYRQRYRKRLCLPLISINYHALCFHIFNAYCNDDGKVFENKGFSEYSKELYNLLFLELPVSCNDERYSREQNIYNLAGSIGKGRYGDVDDGLAELVADIINVCVKENISFHNDVLFTAERVLSEYWDIETVTK